MFARNAHEQDEEHLLDSLKSSASSSTTVIQRRKGFWSFLSQHWTTVLVSIGGLSICVATWCFTWYLSKQVASCPEWATKCTVDPRIYDLYANLAVVQGAVSTVHGIGLAMQASSAHALASMMLWPVLSSKAYQLRDLDIYLKAAQGSWMNLAKAMLKFRKSGLLILPSIVLVTGLCTLNAFIVSWAYKQQEIAVTYTSNYTLGGGLLVPFRQYSPPPALGAAAARGAMMYSSWSQGLSEEPLPRYRDSFLDRSKILKRGSLCANVLSFQQNISCQGHRVEINQTTDETITINTSLKDKEKTVLIRMQPRLTVWVDRIQNMNASRSISTLVFAAINGSMNNSIITKSTEKMIRQGYTNGIAAIACDVDVNLFDQLITIGNGSRVISDISSFANLKGPGNHRSKYGRKADIAIWLGVAPTVFGFSANGAQPMFEYQESGLLTAYTTNMSGSTPFPWPVATLQKFIRISSGAMATAIDSQFNGHHGPNNTITSQASTTKLDPNRSYILLGPSIVLWITIFWLAAISVCMYRIHHIPVMHAADVSELVALTQTADISKMAKSFVLKSNKTKHLGSMKVKYGYSEDGTAGLWSPGSVRESCRTG